jgi:hypothetical protein
MAFVRSVCEDFSEKIAADVGDETETDSATSDASDENHTEANILEKKRNFVNPYSNFIRKRKGICSKWRLR